MVNHTVEYYVNCDRKSALKMWHCRSTHYTKCWTLSLQSIKFWNARNAKCCPYIIRWHRRMAFGEITVETQSNIKNNKIFLDEATFHLNDTVNKQNTRFWSRKNSHWYAKNNVGIVGNRILEPYLFETNLTADIYLECLQFERILGNGINFSQWYWQCCAGGNLWLQKNDAVPHFILDIRNYLNEFFPNRWIFQRETI